MSPKIKELLIFLGVVAAALAFVFFGLGNKKKTNEQDPPIKKTLDSGENLERGPKGRNPKNKTKTKLAKQNAGNGAEDGQNNPGNQAGQAANNGNNANNGNQAKPAGAAPAANKKMPDWAYHKGKVETMGGAIVVGVDYLINRSQTIVVGQVLATKARMTKDEQFIVTDVTVAVDKQLKGNKNGDTMTIQIIGGTLENGLTLDVTHQPHFLPGDEGLFFVDKDPKRLTELAGNAQGYLKIDRPAPDAQFVRDGFDRMIYGLEEKGHLNTDSQNGNKKRLSAKAMIDYVEKTVKSQK